MTCRKNTDEYFHDLGLGNDFLDIIAKHEEFGKCFRIELQY